MNLRTILLILFLSILMISLSAPVHAIPIKDITVNNSSYPVTRDSLFMKILSSDKSDILKEKLLSKYFHNKVFITKSNYKFYGTLNNEENYIHWINKNNILLANTIINNKISVELPNGRVGFIDYNHIKDFPQVASVVRTMSNSSSELKALKDTPYNIIIDKFLNRLYLYKDDKLVKTYPVATGRKMHYTPEGNFKIRNKTINPYYSRARIPGGSPHNPLGVRWMGFYKNYGIHGNSNPNSIGTYASAGCVRMYNDDVVELYSKISIGTSVTIYNSQKTKK